MRRQNSSDFSTWMIKKRDECGFKSQDAAASRIGCSRASLVRWESGVGVPDLKFVTGIAEAYQVETAEVLERMEPGLRHQANVSNWALSLARRIERRSADLSVSKREAIERAIDNILTAAG